jgi:NAD-dependent SIR2 family protein deacetylase
MSGGKLDVDAVAAALREAKHVLVLAGAGISTACGIPDFRSKDGLYALASELGLEEEYGLPQPECLFDISFFDADPRAFFAFAARLLPPRGGFHPSFAHVFIRELERRGKLLTCYTQNIDGIERACGVTAKRIVQCHGTMATAQCRECGARCALEAIRADVEGGRIARCRAPSTRRAAPPQRAGARRSGRKRKRPEEPPAAFRLPPFDAALCGGVIKPDVTFFGEPLNSAVGRRLTLDRAKVDLVLVLGTSLSVSPISDVIRFIPTHVPKVLINRERVVPRGAPDGFAAELLGDCDAVVAALAAKAQWPLFSARAEEPRGDPGALAKSAAGGGGGTMVHGGDGAADEAPAPPRSYEFAPGVHIFRNGIEPPRPTPRLASGDARYAPEAPCDVYACDVCAETIRGVRRSCAACFSFDLCGGCSRAGAEAAHAEIGRAHHVFASHSIVIS